MINYMVYQNNQRHNQVEYIVKLQKELEVHMMYMNKKKLNNKIIN